MKKIFKITIIILLIILILNLLVILVTKKNIYSQEKIIDQNNKYDCILILGAGIRQNKPSPMLEDRLITGINLYKSGLSKKILISGDHEDDNYNEVIVMKNYLIEKGIKEEDIFIDHYGISTYDSIYRTKKIYGVNKAIIVTQKYHLYRSLYISSSLDLKSDGVYADRRKYTNQFKRELREILARSKDFIKSIYKPQSKYMGMVYNINGSGTITNDVK